jgi:hypothetical protein
MKRYLLFLDFVETSNRFLLVNFTLSAPLNANAGKMDPFISSRLWLSIWQALWLLANGNTKKATSQQQQIEWKIHDYAQQQIINVAIYIYIYIYIYNYVCVSMYLITCQHGIQHTYIYRVIKKSLCTWWLQYHRQVQKDFLITLNYLPINFLHVSL